LEVETEFLSTI